MGRAKQGEKRVGHGEGREEHGRGQGKGKAGQLMSWVSNKQRMCHATNKRLCHIYVNDMYQ